MKKRNYIKLSLSNLSKSEIETREFALINGGEQGQCSCGCHYAGSGGSSECDNSAANFNSGLHSPQGGGSCTSNDFEEHQKYLCA